MKIALGFLFLYLSMPFIGLILFPTYQEKVFGNVDSDLIMSCLQHNVVVILVVLFSLIFIKRKNFHFPTNLYKPKFVDTRLKKAIFSLIYILIFTFILGGYKIVMGVPRGELRISMGFLGPIYTFLNNYATPVVLSYSTIMYLMSTKTRSINIKIRVCFFIAFSIGILTGYKFAAILILIPSLIYLDQLLRLKHYLFIGVFFVSIMTISASFVMGNNLEDAFGYVIARVTSVASYGQVTIWNYFPNGVTDSYNVFYRILGNSVTELITGVPSGSVDFLKYSMSRHVTYLGYPDTQGAISGEVNLTLTTFGEAVYHLGRKNYLYYTFFVSLISAFMFNLFFLKRTSNYVLFNAIFSVYFTTVFLQWLANGDICSLLQIPRLVYFGLAYVLLKLIHCKIII